MLDRMLNPTPTIYKWDNFLIGFLPALILPIFAFGFFYVLQMKGMSWEAYVASVKIPSIAAKILSFGCILNLAFFFLVINRNYYNAARGVIGATILWSLPIIYVKFIF